MEALKGYDFIANIIEAKGIEVKFENGKVKSIESTMESSLVIRVHKGRKFGIITCTPNRFQEALNNLKKVLKHNTFGKYEIPSLRKTKVRTYNKRVLLEVDELIELHPESKYKIPSGHIEVGETKLTVVNSQGEEESFKQTNFSFAFDLTNGVDTTFIHYSGNELVEPNELVGEAEFWLQKLPTRKYDGNEIILDYDATAELVEVFVDNFNAYNMYTKLSHFKLGDSVANFDLIDDPTIPLGTHSFPFDCEGTKSRRKFVVKAGKFVTPLTNIFTSKKLGLPLSGNASGLNLASIDTANLIVEGKTEGEKEGLMINFVLGTHTINIASGDASLGIGNGIIVKNGDAIARVKGMINLNLYDAFRQAKFLDKQKNVAGVITKRMKIPAVVIS